jgi:DNA-binding transcriptional regulator LsrR (DeoR family)
VRRHDPDDTEPFAVALSKVQAAAERVKKADRAATEARRKMRATMLAEIAAGRATKSSIARELGVSRQRVQKLLEQ